MGFSEVSQRYAKALYEVAKESKTQEVFIKEMRKLGDLLKKDQETMDFIESPMVNADAKEKVFTAALKDAGVSKDLSNFVSLLAKKDRIELYFEISDAYQGICDEENGVLRGTVRSSDILSPEERERIVEEVTLKTKKRVILEFKEDSSLIGGLIAEVGSYTFNDTLDSHLTRLNEDLNRSLH